MGKTNINIVQCLTEHFLSSAYNKESFEAKEIYQELKTCLNNSGLAYEELDQVLEMVLDYAGESQIQGFRSGLQYGFASYQQLDENSLSMLPTLTGIE